MSLIIFLFVLGVLIVVHEFGHFIAAKKLEVKVEKFSLGFGPRLLAKKKGDTEYSISAIPLGGYVKLAGDNLEEFKGKPHEFLSKSVGKRFWIIFCGPLLNYVLAFLFFWFIFAAGYPALTTKVGGLLDGFGAKAAGLQVGDKITAIDGQRVDIWDDLQKVIQDKQEAETVSLSVLRDGREQAIVVRIQQKDLDDQVGEKRKVGLLGITPYDEVVKIKYGIGKSFFMGLEKSWALTTLTYKSLWRMCTGKMSVKDSVTGPLGIFFITSQAASLGVTALMHLMAILSLSLAIFNLLPFPVLDGGHIALLGIEKIRGRYVSLKTERAIAQTGVTIIVVLAILVTFNDLNRLFGSKIIAFFKK